MFYMLETDINSILCYGKNKAKAESTLWPVYLYFLSAALDDQRWEGTGHTKWLYQSDAHYCSILFIDQFHKDAYVVAAQNETP